MPWRKNTNPYWIVVSEIMLQQTQVDRVEPKFLDFVKQFPSWQKLANANFSEVLIYWQGLGYNRRALYLQKTAQSVVADYATKLPMDRSLIQGLYGIGEGTSGSIMAFAFNEPVVFIETNIRRVFIYNFFANKKTVRDTEIKPILLQCINSLAKHSISPREWYWALMDYGTFLKQSIPNPNQKSHHYSKQSKFNGSVRQLRGQILRVLSESPQSIQQLQDQIDHPKLDQLHMVVKKLQEEGFLQKSQLIYSIRAK